VFVVFQNFKLVVENKVGCKLKKLIYDNGTKYTIRKLKKLCEKAKIQHQLVVAYTPQQNGVSERKNRSIMEMTRCLLIEKDIQKSFWAMITNTYTYLLNVLCIKALKGKTPFEAW